MDLTLLYRLACILLLPLLPAVLLYTKLPSKTAVSGPFKGLNLKLSGAFGGYFLLVLIAISITVLTDKGTDLKAEINKLQGELDSREAWTVEGQFQADTLQETRIFVLGSAVVQNRLFNVNNVLLPQKKEKINLALCFYNPRLRNKYKILNINENFPAEIDTFNIRIDRTGKTIHIAKLVAF